LDKKLNKKAENHGYIVVFITARDAEEAQKIAKALVKRRQAACVNIVSSVDSHFWWKDKLDSSQESLLIVKTKESLLPELIKSVKKIHSYGIPEIIAIPIIGGSRDYLEWIDSETI
jgi:periplasmic divalent cation tolerance protein